MPTGIAARLHCCHTVEAHAFPDAVLHFNSLSRLTLPCAGRDIFGGRTANDKKGAAITHMAVIPPKESKRCARLSFGLAGKPPITV